jgi:hypothetical protein
MDVLADRLVKLDSVGNPIDIIDERIRIAQGGAGEEPASAEELAGLMRAIVLDKRDVEKSKVGTAWRRVGRQRVAYRGAQLEAHHVITFTKLPLEAFVDGSMIPVAVRGTIETDPIALHGRTLVGSGTLAGTTWLGRWFDSVGSVRMELVLRDTKTGMEVGRIADDMGHSAFRADGRTEYMAMARASFAVEHRGDCLQGFGSPPRTVSVTMAPREGIASRMRDKGVLPDLTDAAPDVGAETGARISAALIARRADFMACTTTPARLSGLDLDLTSRPFKVSAPFNLAPTQVACVVQLAQECLAQVDRGNARHLQLLFASGHAEEEAPPLPEVARAQIRSLVGGRVEQVRACYKAALSGWPQLPGRFTVNFSIGGDGSVVYAWRDGADETLPQLTCCIFEQLKSLRFAAPKNGRLVRAEYSFDLKP